MSTSTFTSISIFMYMKDKEEKYFGRSFYWWAVQFAPIANIYRRFILHAKRPDRPRDPHSLKFDVNWRLFHWGTADKASR